MSEPTASAGEWTNVDVEDLWEKGGSIAVRDAHNAALAAEREDMKELSRSRESWLRQCATALKRVDVLRTELEEAREQIKTLVDALNEIAYDETIGSYKACDLASNALAKAGVKP